MTYHGDISSYSEASQQPLVIFHAALGSLGFILSVSTLNIQKSKSIYAALGSLVSFCQLALSIFKRVKAYVTEN